jgi:SAM-dependent methyltransferase
MNGTSCRSCGAAELEVVLSLGRTPLAGLLTRQQLTLPEPRYPLDLAICLRCALVQITETVPPAELFDDSLYLSSHSETMVRHAQALVERLVGERGLSATSLAIQIASNDGYLLQFYREASVPVLGIEPARNAVKVAQSRGIPTLCEFFDSELASSIVRHRQRADVIHAHGVLAHVADLNDVVSGIGAVLKDAGVLIVEVPYLKDLLDRCEFDTIYHEHLCYFSLTALVPLFERHGLQIEDVERIAIHGGSLRLFVKRAVVSRPTPAVKGLLADEAGWGVSQVETYRNFGARVAALKASLTSTLRTLKGRGDRIAAYGAAAKGSTLLNYTGIGKETLDFVVDRNPDKQGRYMPGVHLPIWAPERLLEEMPDHVLLLSWNLEDEILEQQKTYRALGGRFIIPVPDVRVA